MRKHIALIINLSLIHFLLGLDINIVSVSLPSVAAHFDVDVNVVSRIMWVYFLVLTCFLLAFGKLGDIKGFKKIYISGIAVFTVGSIFCYFSNDFNLLVASRVFQAFGSAVLFALTPAIIASSIPKEIRGKVFGINYSFTALGGIAGRAASGFLIQGLGWNSIFLINIPVGIITLFISYKYITESSGTVKSERFDFTGMLFAFAGFLSLLYAINTGDYFGWSSKTILILFAASILFIVLFVIRQNNISYPLINLKILKNRSISYSVVSFIFVYIITNGMIYLTPFLLLWMKGFSKEETGLLMAVPSLLQFGSGYLSGYLSDRINTRVVRITGMVLISLSLLFYTFISAATGISIIILILAFYGFAIGFFIPSNTNKIMSSAPAEQKGVISSLMTTSVRLGSALGVVLFGAVFAWFVPEKNPMQNGTDATLLLQGFRSVFIFGLAVSLAGLLFVLGSNDKSNKKSL